MFSGLLSGNHLWWGRTTKLLAEALCKITAILQAPSQSPLALHLFTAKAPVVLSPVPTSSSCTFLNLSASRPGQLPSPTTLSQNLQKLSNSCGATPPSAGKASQESLNYFSNAKTHTAQCHHGTKICFLCRAGVGFCPRLGALLLTTINLWKLEKIKTEDLGCHGLITQLGQNCGIFSVYWGMFQTSALKFRPLERLLDFNCYLNQHLLVLTKAPRGFKIQPICQLLIILSRQAVISPAILNVTSQHMWNITNSCRNFDPES